MKDKRILAKMLGALGMFAAIGTICISFSALNTSPKMLQPPKGAVERADALMSAVCEGDFESAGNMLYGRPNLGQTPDSQETAETLLWNAFISSMEYDFPDECYVTQSGVTLDMHVRSLKIASVTDALKEHAQTMLNERVKQATDVKEIYNANNEYREDFVMNILRDATEEALKDNGVMQEQVIPLHLTFEHGQWWIQPSTELLNILSGSVTD